MAKILGMEMTPKRTFTGVLLLCTLIFIHIFINSQVMYLFTGAHLRRITIENIMCISSILALVANLAIVISAILNQGIQLRFHRVYSHLVILLSGLCVPLHIARTIVQLFYSPWKGLPVVCYIGVTKTIFLAMLVFLIYFAVKLRSVDLCHSESYFKTVQSHSVNSSSAEIKNNSFK